MPVFCTVEVPEGKNPETIKSVLVNVSNVLMKEFDAQPNQVRVTVNELPKNRYIVGGVMAYDIDSFK